MKRGGNIFFTVRNGAIGMSLLLTVGCHQVFFDDPGLSESGQQPPKAEVAILGGLIVDGSGAAPFPGDIALSDGKIVEISAPNKLTRAAAVKIDARGKYVAPGLIDAHAHGDPLDVDFENASAMGVTTVVLGQDGANPGGVSIRSSAGTSSLAAWVEAVNREGESVNVAFLVGHGSVRTEAGAVRSPARGEVLHRMGSLVAQAMDAGALGVSQGLEYDPGIYADAIELAALAQAVGAHDGVIHSHVRTENTGEVASAIDELVAQGEFANVHISHLKIVMGNDPVEARAIVTRLGDLGRFKLTADVYPYLAGSTGVALLFPNWAKTESQFHAAMPARRDELVRHLRGRVESRNGPAATLFTSGPYAGSTLAEAAEANGVHYADFLIDKVGPEGAQAAYFVMDQRVQDVFVRHPQVAIASDGYPHMRHPRSYGTFTRVLEQYVRQEKSLGLPEAIRKMSRLPAEQLGLRDRGLLLEGRPADLIVFDLDDVKEAATWENPTQLAQGMSHVFVNGVPVIRDGMMTNRLPGKVLVRAKGE